MMNLLTSALSGTNYILHACGILESYMVSSLEKFIVDEESCGIVKHLRKGIPVNEHTLAFDTLKQVGPQGEFVTHPHTLSEYRSLYNPRLFDRSSYLQWEENGSEDIAVTANREWKKRVGSYVRPELPKDIYKALRSYVDSV
jgi:trimethylamine--corrinoid protein Co-methyltransferase